MAVTTDAAPYTPPSAVLEVVRGYRDRGLQSPITKEVLMRSGISESLAPRTLSALTILELVDNEGSPTENFDALRLAPADEYQERFQEFLRSVYPDIFAYYNPAEDDDTKLRDAFRGYEPRGQQGRMVTLFKGLCEHAGWTNQPSESQPSLPTTGRTRRRSISREPAPPQRSVTPRRSNLPAPIEGLLQSLPAEGASWPDKDKDRFLKTLRAVLDFCYPTNEVGEKESGSEVMS